VPILSSGVLLLRPSAYVIAGVSGALYTSVLFFKFFMGEGPEDITALIAPVFFYSVAFQILAAIVTRFSAANAITDRVVVLLTRLTLTVIFGIYVFSFGSPHHLCSISYKL
jgi:hypothetical protein